MGPPWASGSTLDSESMAERSILVWGKFNKTFNLISPVCPRHNSAFVVQKSVLKHRHFISFHFLDIFFSFFFLFLLLILRFGDEVDFSAGFPARPVGSLGGPIRSAWLLVLLGLPTPSSTSPLILRVGPGLPSGWLSGYQLADGLTRPSYSVVQVPIFLKVFGDRSQPSGKSKVSREDTTLWS